MPPAYLGPRPCGNWRSTCGLGGWKSGHVFGFSHPLDITWFPLQQGPGLGCRPQLRCLVEDRKEMSVEEGSRLDGTELLLLCCYLHCHVIDPGSISQQGTQCFLSFLFIVLQWSHIVFIQNEVIRHSATSYVMENQAFADGRQKAGNEMIAGGGGKLKVGRIFLYRKFFLPLLLCSTITHLKTHIHTKPYGNDLHSCWFIWMFFSTERGLKAAYNMKKRGDHQ